MSKPRVRLLVASPCGDIPVDDDKLDFPLEGDPLKTPYRLYFDTIQDFLTRNGCISLLHALSKQYERRLSKNEIREIIIRSEKHGVLYHPASIDVVSGNNKIKFGLNVAVTDQGKDSLKKEFILLKTLHNKFNLPYLPEPYYADELNSMVLLLEEWFEGYHEFHISNTEDGKQKVKLWEYGKGDRFISSEQSFEIYRKASMILTLYYDIENSTLIYPWHHAAGDFVVKIVNENNPPLPPFVKGWNSEGSTLKKWHLGDFWDKKIDVRLTTVRGYEPFMESDDDELNNPALALFYFLLNLSIQMRLDKIDGVGDIVWADDSCVDATVSGFFEGLKQKEDLSDFHCSATSFLRLLQSFSEDDFRNTFGVVAGHFEQTRDFAIIKRNLENHISRFYITLQNFLL